MLWTDIVIATATIALFIATVVLAKATIRYAKATDRYVEVSEKLLKVNEQLIELNKSQLRAEKVKIISDYSIHIKGLISTKTEDMARRFVHQEVEKYIQELQEGNQAT